MSNTQTSTSGGLGLPTVLFLIFLVLKLTGTIDWSWWWVTSPLWIGFSLWLLLVVFVVIPIVMYNQRSTRGALDRYSRTYRR